MTNRSRVTSGVRRARISGLLTAAAIATLPAVASAQVDNFVFYYNGNTVGIVSPPGGAGHPAMGGYSYDSANNVFFDATFTGAGQGIYRVDLSTSPPANQYVDVNAWNSFLISTDVSTGATNGAATVTSTLGDIQLNPTSITINSITYPAGTLGIINEAGKASISSIVNRPLSKLVYGYDLRKIGGAAGAGRDWNSDGIVQWNDAFFPISSFQDQSTLNGNPTSTSNNVARRFAFSSNGQSIYFNDSSAAYGGVYKVNLTTSAMTKVLTSSQVNTEPFVVPSATRDFGGGSGDQILIQGGSDIGNNGGVSFMVDNGASVSAPQTLLSAKQLAWFYDVAGVSADIRGITADSSGNLYMLNTGTQAGIYMYDSSGRLVKVNSAAEQRVFDVSQGVSYNVNQLDTKVRTSSVNPALKEVLYSDSGLRAPAGVTVYMPGDFDRDMDVDLADATALKSRLGLRGAVVASIATSTPFAQTSTNNLRYDLNGATTVGTISGVAIDWKDVKIFQAFSGMSAGDVEMDFDVDTADLTTMGANYGSSGKLFSQGNIASARIAEVDKDEVNFGDLVTLAASWTAAKPALAAVGSISSTDIDRAFSITANGTISEYVATGNGTWSNSANWSNATVPNSNGAVASLLTKPTNDVALTIDSSVTLGQLNFDHYFSYALSGGGILRMNGNGTTAEINTFAASPTISVSTELQTATNVTVTYAVDTLGISSAISGSGSLSKAGAGRLLLSGTNTYSGTTTANAGTLQATKPAALSGYNVASKIFANNGGTVAVNANGQRDEWTTQQIDTLRSNGTFAAGSQLGIDTGNAITYSNFEYGSNIGGALGITKAGATTMTLSGSNTYSGNTLVNAGTLAATNTGALPGYNSAGKVQVASGATLAVKAGGAGWSSANIDTLRSNATLPAGSTLAIDTGNGNFTYGSVVSGAHNLAKIGSNTLTVTAANTYTGSTQANAGTLQLDFNAGGAPGNNIISTSSALQMGGGTLLLSGKTAVANAQTVNTTTFNPGASAITLTPAGANLALTLGAVTRTVGSTVEITLPSGSQAAANGVLTTTGVSSSILPATITVGKTDWAGKSTNNIIALATYTNDAWASANNTTVTTSSGVAADATTNSLRFNAAGVNTVTLGGNATIGSGGLLVTPNVAANTSTITGGTLLGRSAGDLVIHQHNTSGGLTIASNLGDNSASGVTKSGAGVATLTGTMSYAGATTVNVGTLKYQTNLTSSASVNVTGGKLELADGGGSARVIKSASVAVNSANGGKIDLRDNKLITATHIGGWNGVAYDGITGLIASGRNGGVWDGAGITTSMPDATGGSGYTLIGVATGSEVKGIAATATDTWGGQSVTGTDSLVMYTYGGDANLSGNVDIDDYGQIDFNASTGGVLPGWYNGDFDYNGIQDIDDYGIIDFVVGIQGAPFPTGSGLTIAAVPEPASFGLIAVGALTTLRRRRRA